MNNERNLKICFSCKYISKQYLSNVFYFTRRLFFILLFHLCMYIYFQVPFEDFSFKFSNHTSVFEKAIQICIIHTSEYKMFIKSTSALHMLYILYIPFLVWFFIYPRIEFEINNLEKQERILNMRNCVMFYNK